MKTASNPPTRRKRRRGRVKGEQLLRAINDKMIWKVMIAPILKVLDKNRKKKRKYCENHTDVMQGLEDVTVREYVFGRRKKLL